MNLGGHTQTMYRALTGQKVTVASPPLQRAGFPLGLKATAQEHGHWARKPQRVSTQWSLSICPVECCPGTAAGGPERGPQQTGEQEAGLPGAMATSSPDVSTHHQSRQRGRPRGQAGHLRGGRATALQSPAADTMAGAVRILSLCPRPKWS